MKRAVLVHGWSGSPDEQWFPWLRVELEKIGYKVDVPFMREHDEPKISEWLGHYGALELNKEKFAGLGSKIIVIHDAGHFTSEDGFDELPQIAEEIKQF